MPSGLDVGPVDGPAAGEQALATSRTHVSQRGMTERTEGMRLTMLHRRDRRMTSLRPR
jgi:hypothetical protein